MKKATDFSLSSLIFQEISPLKMTSLKTLLFIFFPAILILVAIAMISQIYHVPLNRLTSDPDAIAGINPLSGALSNLGIVLWCAATASCALAAMILRTRGTKKVYLFFLYSSLLSAYLMFDDLFQFHEDLSSTIGLTKGASAISTR